MATTTTICSLIPEDAKLYHSSIREYAHCNIFNGRHIRFVMFHVDTHNPTYIRESDKNANYAMCRCVTTIPITKQNIQWPCTTFLYNPTDAVNDLPSGFVDLYSPKNYSVYKNQQNAMNAGFDYPLGTPIGFARVQHCQLA